MPPGPAQTYRNTILVTGGIGIAVALFIIAVGAWSLWQKSNLHKTHERVTATVQEVSRLCGLQSKSGKSWYTRRVIPCAEAEAFVSERSGVLTPWRSVPDDYARLTYVAMGATQEVLLPASIVTDAPTVTKGQQVTMYADPNTPTDVEKPYSEKSVTAFYGLAAFGIGLALFVLAIGWAVGTLNYRRAVRVLAAGGTIGADGMAYMPAPAAGRRPADTRPAWAKAVNVLGIGVLVLGLAFTAIGLYSGINDQNNDAITGSLIVGAFAVAVWRLCAHIFQRSRTRRQISM